MNSKTFRSPRTKVFNKLQFLKSNTQVILFVDQVIIVVLQFFRFFKLIVSVRAKLFICKDNGLMTQAKTPTCEQLQRGRELGALKLVLYRSNGGESLMCYGDGATKNKKMSVHEKCLKQGKEFIDLHKEVHIQTSLSKAAT